MKRALRGNVTTAVLVVGAIVAGVVVLRDRGAVTTDEAARRKGDLFEAWRADAITSVEVTARGRTARLEREAKREGAPAPLFRVKVGGESYAADEQAADDYLGKLEFAAFVRRAEGVDRAAMRLDPPAASVRVAMGAQTLALAIGGEAPSPPGARYAEVAGRGAFVVSAQLAAALDVDVDAFRSRTLVPYVSSDLEGLSLDGEGGARRLVRAPWGGGRGAGFRFDGTTTEGSARADAAAVDRMLLALGHLQAERFLADDEARRASRAGVTLTLKPRDRASPAAVLVLGGACPGHEELVVAVREAPTRAAACVSAEALEALTVPAKELVDTRLVGAPIDELTELTVTEGARRLELARSGAGFHLRAPSDRVVPAEIGRGVLESVLSVRAARFVTGKARAELGLDAPRGRVRAISLDTTKPPSGVVAEPDAGMEAGAGERVEELVVSSDREGTTYVERLEDGVIAAIPSERARDLLPSELLLRPHKLYDGANKRFRSLRVERIAPGGAREVQSLTRTEAGGFALAEPKGAGLEPDSGLASELIDALGELTVERWVAEKDDGSFGLAPPRVVLEATLADAGGDAGAQTIRVLLGAPTSAGAFARHDDDPAVFVAPKALELAASRWLLDRSALTVAPDAVTRVTLRAPGKTDAVVAREGDTWRLVGATGAAATAKAAAVRDAVGDLMAEGAVSIGPPLAPQGFGKPSLELVIERDGRAPVRLRFGVGDVLQGTSVVYARRDGVDATYALAQAKVRPLLW